jgi:hypothetical protein
MLANGYSHRRGRGLVCHAPRQECRDGWDAASRSRRRLVNLHCVTVQGSAAMI